MHTPDIAAASKVGVIALTDPVSEGPVDALHLAGISKPIALTRTSYMVVAGICGGLAFAGTVTTTLNGGRIRVILHGALGFRNVDDHDFGTEADSVALVTKATHLQIKCHIVSEFLNTFPRL